MPVPFLPTAARGRKTLQVVNRLGTPFGQAQPIRLLETNNRWFFSISGSTSVGDDHGLWEVQKDTGYHIGEVAATSTWVDPETACVGIDGAIYAIVYRSSDLMHKVRRWDPVTDTTSLWATWLGDPFGSGFSDEPWGMVFRDDGTLWIGGGYSGWLDRISADGTVVTRIAVPNVSPQPTDPNPGFIPEVWIGDVLYGYDFNSNLLTYDPAAGTFGWLANLKNDSVSPYAGMFVPEGMVLHEGRFWFVSRDHFSIVSCEIDGSDPVMEFQFYDSFWEPIGISSIGGRLLVTDVAFPRLHEIIDTDPAAPTLYVGEHEYWSNNNGFVWRYNDPQWGKVNIPTFSETNERWFDWTDWADHDLFAPYYGAVAETGDVYIINQDGVHRLDSELRTIDGMIEPLIPWDYNGQFDDFADIQILKSKLYVSRVEGSKLQQFNLDGVLEQEWTIPGFTRELWTYQPNQFGLKYDLSEVYWTDSEWGGSVNRYDLINDVPMTPFVTAGPFQNFFGVRGLPDGGVLVSSYSWIERYDANAVLLGDWFWAGSPQWLAGSLFGNPGGNVLTIQLDPDGQHWWCGQHNTGGSWDEATHYASSSSGSSLNGVYRVPLDSYRRDTDNSGPVDDETGYTLGATWFHADNDSNFVRSAYMMLCEEPIGRGRALAGPDSQRVHVKIQPKSGI